MGDALVPPSGALDDAPRLARARQRALELADQALAHLHRHTPARAIVPLAAIAALPWLAALLIAVFGAGALVGAGLADAPLVKWAPKPAPEIRIVERVVSAAPAAAAPASAPVATSITPVESAGPRETAREAPRTHARRHARRHRAHRRPRRVRAR